MSKRLSHILDDLFWDTPLEHICYAQSNSQARQAIDLAQTGKLGHIEIDQESKTLQPFRPA